MREWSIPSEGPLSLRIAADVRLTIPNYIDDQIWELVLGGGDPPALTMQTTYGLRARSMRIFPGFGWGEASVVHPAHFAQPVVVQCFLPNYLRLAFFPFESLEVRAEYWVYASNLLAGRYSMRSHAIEARELRLQLNAVLHPGENPEVMDESVLQGVTVLSGRTASLAPVVFLSGGAWMEQAPYPSLLVTQSLAPGESKHWIWVHSAHGSHEQSFDAARELAAKSWDAEIARLELLAASMVDVETGDENWDIALAHSQNAALSAYVGPTAHLPHPSFVLSRTPDRGYSARGDGSDYGLFWDGQTAAHAYLNLSQVVLAAPQLAKGVIRNFLASQRADGGVDWKPGLAGQRNGMLSIPLLATMTWKIYQHTLDAHFLESVFKPLNDFLESWFAPSDDRDEDGFPEWENTTHTAFDDNPTFVRWHRWGQGLDITLAESPDLAAYLYRECQSLIQIAAVLQEDRYRATLEARRDKLREAVEASWSQDTLSYHYIDRDLHVTSVGELLGSGRGQFTLEVGRTFDPPVRILVRSEGEEGLSHAVKVFIHGRGRRGRSRVEKLTERRFQWFWEFGTSNSDKHYVEIERVEVSGLSEEFKTEVWVAGYSRQDQTLLLPLWAGIPAPERARKLVHETIMDPERYWRPNGIPACAANDPAYAADGRNGAGGVWMFWNQMIGEGLVAYGYLEQAAELVGRLISATVETLKSDKAFREAYNADQPGGLGDRHHMWGIAPLSLFLETLGVRLITPNKVWLRPQNPFPWPVTVRWRGLTLECLKDRIEVTFPNGQRIITRGTQAQMVELIES